MEMIDLYGVNGPVSFKRSSIGIFPRTTQVLLNSGKQSILNAFIYNTVDIRQYDQYTN